MKVISGIIFATILLGICLVQVSSAFAKQHDTSNTQGPITSANCKPGWGFGDENHCHFGPPGQIN